MATIDDTIVTGDEENTKLSPQAITMLKDNKVYQSWVTLAKALDKRDNKSWFIPRRNQKIAFDEVKDENVYRTFLRAIYSYITYVRNKPKGSTDVIRLPILGRKGKDKFFSVTTPGEANVPIGTKENASKDVKDPNRGVKSLLLGSNLNDFNALIDATGRGKIISNEFNKEIIDAIKQADPLKETLNDRLIIKTIDPDAPPGQDIKDPDTPPVIETKESKRVEAKKEVENILKGLEDIKEAKSIIDEHKDEPSIMLGNLFDEDFIGATVLNKALDAEIISPDEFKEITELTKEKASDKLAEIIKKVQEDKTKQEIVEPVIKSVGEAKLSDEETLSEIVERLFLIDILDEEAIKLSIIAGIFTKENAEAIIKDKKDKTPTKEEKDKPSTEEAKEIKLESKLDEREEKKREREEKKRDELEEAIRQLEESGMDQDAIAIAISMFEKKQNKASKRSDRIANIFGVPISSFYGGRDDDRLQLFVPPPDALPPMKIAQSSAIRNKAIKNLSKVKTKSKLKRVDPGARFRSAGPQQARLKNSRDVDNFSSEDILNLLLS